LAVPSAFLCWPRHTIYQHLLCRPRHTIYPTPMTLRFTIGLLLMTACVAPPVAQFSEQECAGWAVAGECDSNKAFMMQSCRKSCQKVALERRAYDKRCPPPSNHTPALLPGAMPHTFSRIMNDFADLKPEMLSHDPPVVLFNSFMSDTEADAFMRHGAGHYERSRALEMTDQGKMAEVETSYRTSSHAWCQAEDCVHDRDIQRVSQRVANVTQTPETNAEYIMLLYYHACKPIPSHHSYSWQSCVWREQHVGLGLFAGRDRTDDDCAFYRQHTDYIGSDRHKLQGVRIYTLMAFLVRLHAYLKNYHVHAMT